jgi:hypothetical protein
MVFAALSSSPVRRGITLLEVLVAMFVLAVGILSIFSLFIAGRELESRATIKSEAIAYAGTLSNTIANEWIEAWPDWLYVDQSGGFARTGLIVGSGTCISLPVLIDPCGLSGDTAAVDRGIFLQKAVAGTYRPDWKWSQMTPLTSGTVKYQPFARVTLPLTTGGLVPMAREGVVASISDQDSVEYQMPLNNTDPPRNAFELGRRKRGSDLVPALFVAASGALLLDNTKIEPGTPINRTLLIFHKPGTDLESGFDVGSPSNAAAWPAGYVELTVTTLQPEGRLEASLKKVPSDSAVVRRSLRPGNWLLIAEPQGPVTGRWFNTRWVKIRSATTNSTAADPNGWLLVLDEFKETLAGTSCYAFERLVHAVKLDPATLP